MIIRLINITDNKLGELDIDGILYDIDYRIKHNSFEKKMLILAKHGFYKDFYAFASKYCAHISG